MSTRRCRPLGDKGVEALHTIFTLRAMKRCCMSVMLSRTKSCVAAQGASLSSRGPKAPMARLQPQAS